MIEIKVLASSSKGNCYLINDHHTKILIECGIPIKQIREGLGFRLSEVAACLISHEHKDHCKAIKEVMRAGIDIYAIYYPSDIGEQYRWYHANFGQQFNIGTFTIRTFELQHDVPNTGYLIYSNATKDKLLYITDSYYCKYKFSGLTHIMLECNHSYDILDRNVENGSLPLAMKKRLMQSHFSLENVKKFLLANDLSKVKEIYLLHLSDGNSDAELFKSEIQKITGKVVIVCDS